MGKSCNEYRLFLETTDRRMESVEDGSPPFISLTMTHIENQKAELKKGENRHGFKYSIFFCKLPILKLLVLSNLYIYQTV